MTTSVRINLLPHREQKRQARQRQFVSLAALVAILGLGIVGLVHFVLATQIESQNNRNALLKTEIVKLDEQIKEIDKLRDQIAQVLSRKQVVETLQSNRNEAVHLLDQLVRQLPDGIYLRSIKQVGTKVTLVGYAQSNARVSTLMRNVEASPWLGQPELVEIKLVTPPATAGADPVGRRSRAAERIHDEPAGQADDAAGGGRRAGRGHEGPGRTGTGQGRCAGQGGAGEGRAGRRSQGRRRPQGGQRMTLDDLRRLNIRDVGNWPTAPKFGLLGLMLLVILGLGAFFDWKDQYESLEQARAQEQKLRVDYAEKKAKAVNYDLYVAQLAEIEQSFGALVKQLPNRSEIDALLTDVNQAGLGRGLVFELFKPAVQERLSDFYAELPINIRITGNYHDMGAFASDVAQLPRIVTLNDLAISTEKGSLTLDAVAKTFRYLDEDEIAKQRALARQKDKEKGKK